MLASKEIRDRIEDLVEKFKQQMIQEDYFNAVWTLDKLKNIVSALDIIKKKMKG